MEEDTDERHGEISAREQAEALRLANKAAVGGDIPEMVRQLNRSRFLDGVMRRLTHRWSKTLGASGCEEVIADTMESLYVAVRAGKLRQSIEGFIWITARNKASDEHGRRKDLVEVGGEIAGPGSEETGDQPSRDVLRREALAVARRLLPRLGHENIVRVMGMILDGVEEQVPLGNPEIADALGLPLDVVRKSRERGFRRLRERAEQEGATLTLEHALAVEDSETEEE